jgi:hypothetical protein
MESSIGRVSQSLDARTMQEVTLVPYQLFIVCKQVQNFLIISKKILKNSCKDHKFHAFLAFQWDLFHFSPNFFQSYSRNIYAESGRVQRWPHWVIIELRHDCSSLQISTIFVSTNHRKNIKRFSMRQTLTKFCCRDIQFTKLRSFAKAGFQFRRCTDVRRLVSMF